MAVKKLIIFIIVIFSFNISPAKEKELEFVNEPNKKLSNNINNGWCRYVNGKCKWVPGVKKVLKSSIIGYVENNVVEYYSHNSNIDTQYDIASVTKTFTAIIIIKLHYEKKLHIDSSVNGYVNYYDRKVTIRHLITHTVGRPHGKRISYSNVNYVLLKDIIEKVTDNSYENNVHKYILYPLEMCDTEPRYSNGAGSIFSTMRDLSKYCTMIINKGEYNGKNVLTKYEYNLLFASTIERTKPGWHWTTGGYEFIKGGSIYKSGRWYYTISGIEIWPEKGKALIYIGSKNNCLTPYVSRWRNWIWRYLRNKN